ncbi:hypothetical protein [Alcaligenes faecalis]|uniref:Uncharacterized protein n=1 Tax=Alcaligenes faecalis TaxID=511 RepID=A0ABY7N6E7_ALCFA|nr:hypothetical protein [Alcaligenes faecalis]WBM39667.1 hypothetical protein M2J83_07610 [Alcaligenes faecalis]
MKERKYSCEWQMIAALFSGAILGGVIGLTLSQIWIIRDQFLSLEDIFSFATAIGTLGAVIVAIYFATRDDRRRMSEHNLIAKLTAIGMETRLHEISFKVGYLISCIRKDPSSLNDMEKREEYRSLVESMLGMVRMDEVVSLSRVNGVLGSNLMKVKDRLHLVLTSLGLKPGSDSNEMSKFYLEDLVAIADLIESEENKIREIGE